MDILNFVFLVASLVGSSCAIPVALSTTDVEKAVNLALNIAVAKFVEDFKVKPIPDFSGSASKVSYAVTGNRLRYFNQVKVSVSFRNQVALALDEFGLGLTEDWEYRYEKGFIKIRDNGSYTASADGLSIRTSIILDVDLSSGKISISQDTCRASLDTLDVNMEGGASWIYNLFLGKLTQDFRGQIGDMLCKSLGEEIVKQSDKIKPIRI